MFSWQSMMTTLFFRPSCTFLDLSLRFLFCRYHYLDPFSVIPTSDRTNGHGGRPLRLFCRVLSMSRCARTHAQDAAQHTCRHVQSVGFIQAKASSLSCRPRDWFTSLLYFTQGAKMGRRKRSRTHSGETIWGGRVPPRHPRLPNQFCSSEGWRVGHRGKESPVCVAPEEKWFGFVWREPVESLRVTLAGSPGLSFIRGSEAEQRLRIESLILWEVHLQILFLLPFMSEMTGYLTADGSGWPENLPLLL